jgi:hypothetical protein
MMKKQTERLVAFGFGVVFIVILLVLAILKPTPTPFQYTVFRIVLALAAGGVATMIPGFLTVTVSKSIRAGGALAVFLIVYFYSPAGLTGITVETEEQRELEKPIVGMSLGRGLVDWVVPTLPAASKQQQVALTVEALDVSDPNGLTAEVLRRRYKKLRFIGARIRVPSGSAIVANEIEGERGAALVGTDFSVIAQRMANFAIDTSASRAPGAAAGTVYLYVKAIQNARILATGADGAAGPDGGHGKDGGNGGKGSDGDCSCCGGYRGANAGGNGRDGENGEDGRPGENGKAGGLIVVTSIVSPASATVDVAGGRGGAGGKAGAAGAAGQGGPGGAGCTGLGGSQPSQAAGISGKPGRQGQAGTPGSPGAPGEYRLKLIKSFDGIVQVLNANTNEAVHGQLRAMR